jgi:hypothetical protein
MREVAQLLLFLVSCLVLSGIAAPGDEWAKATDDASLSAGHFHTCAIEQRSGVSVGGPIKCWGNGDLGQTTPRPGMHTQVSCGRSHCCAVKLDETVNCWGEIQEPRPYHFPRFNQISSGEFHTCGVQKDGSILCWGRNHFGESTPLKGVFVQVTMSSKYRLD